MLCEERKKKNEDFSDPMGDKRSVGTIKWHHELF